MSSIRRVGSLKSSKLSRQDSESEAEELQLAQSRDTVTDLGNIEEWGCRDVGGRKTDSDSDLFPFTELGQSHR